MVWPQHISEEIAKRQTELDQLQLIDYDYVELKVNEICNNTFLGDLVICEVKISGGNIT